jgi:hypothetical protein
VRGGRYNAGTYLPAPAFAARSVTSAGTSCVEGACNQSRTRRLGKHRNPVDQSALLMFLLPFKKCGDPVTQVREHRTGVTRALDRRFER